MTRLRVAIRMNNPDLRNLIREDLEQQGYEVVSVSAGPAPVEDVDVVVTEYLEPTAPLTVWVIDDLTWPGRSIARLPFTRLDELSDVIAARRQTDGRDLRSTDAQRTA